MYQYIAFKSRKPEYLTFGGEKNFEELKQVIQKEGLDYLLRFVKGAEITEKNGDEEDLWQIARETPHYIASSQNEFIVQMIDEFQFLTSEIY